MRAALLSLLALVLAAGCSSTPPPPAVPPAAPPADPAPAEAAFATLGEWHTFSNGTHVRVELTEVMAPADKDYPQMYPAVRALRMLITVENPTDQTIGVGPFAFGPRFATLPGGMTARLCCDETDWPRLIRPGQTATKLTYHVPAEGALWPPGTEFITAVLTPLFEGVAPEPVHDEIAEWLGVPPTGMA